MVGLFSGGGMPYGDLEHLETPPLTWVKLLPSLQTYACIASSATGLNLILKQLKNKQASKQTKKPLIFLCNVAWLAYKLPDQEVWPQNNTLKHSTIFQPDLFCCNFSKYSEVPYVQAFMSLSKNWDLWEGHRSNESCPDSVFPEDLNLSPYFVSSGNLLG
jgi:hypothetical protein